MNEKPTRRERFFNRIGLPRYIQNQTNAYLMGYKDGSFLQEAVQDSYNAYKLQENKAWFSGDSTILRRFYKLTPLPIGYSDYINNHNFYRSVQTTDISNTPVYHLPLASSISLAMSSLLFSSLPSIKVDTGNKETSKVLNDLLEDEFEENNIAQLLQNAAQFESYSGGVGFKINIDPQFSDYPIIQAYPKERIAVRKKYEKPYEIVFIDDLEYNKKKYTLYSVYGKGYINYELYDKNDKRIDLTDLPLTAKLKPVIIKDSTGKQIKVIMAVYKSNRNVDNVNADLDKDSDYEGLIDIFQALDENLSSWVKYLRDGKIFTMIHENMLKTDARGNTYNPAIFGISTFVRYDDIPEADETEIKREIPSLNITSYEETQMNLIKMALVRVGLSPVTLGLNDYSGANASAEALNIREGASMRTRDDKIKLWREALKELTKLLLIYTEILSGDYISDRGAIEYTLKKDYTNYDYLVEFPPYQTLSYEEKVEKYKGAIDSGLISWDVAFNDIYKDILNDEEIEKLINEKHGKTEETNEEINK